MKEERYRRRDMERVFFLFQLCITKILLIIYQAFLLYYLTLIISSYFNLTTHVNVTIPYSLQTDWSIKKRIKMENVK